MATNLMRTAALSITLLSALTAGAIADPPTPDPQMAAVLNQLAAFHAPPIETLTPVQARRQPLPGDAVKALLQKQGQSTAPEHVGSVRDTTVPGPAGLIPVRVYSPDGAGPFPILVYFHGGGFVIAGINAYDSSCRALCNGANCVVISVGYPLAPEHMLPAAEEASYAATQFIMDNAANFNGDADMVAVGGESAGGGLATSVCLMARHRGQKMPVYQLLVYPVVDDRFDTPSYIENAQAHPLNKAMMQWFFHYATGEADLPHGDYTLPLQADSLEGLPPATVIGAEIDPLRSEGKAYADRLKAAGVPVHYRLYTGVTHEFFGMGAVLDQAKAAEAFACQNLNKVFGHSAE